MTFESNAIHLEAAAPVSVARPDRATALLRDDDHAGDSEAETSEKGVPTANIAEPRNDCR